MKGFKDSDGKFRPISSSKGIRKKSEKNTQSSGKVITTGIRKARGDNNAEILRNRIEVFNNYHLPKVEYGNQGGGNRFLQIEGTQDNLSPAVTKSEAIDYLEAIDKYVDKIVDVVDSRNDQVLTLQKSGKKVDIKGDGTVVRLKRGTSPDTTDFEKTEFWIEHGYISSTISGLEGAKNLGGSDSSGKKISRDIQNAIDSLKKAKVEQHAENKRVNG